MFSKLAIFSVAALAIFASAVPVPGGDNNGQQCGTGQVQCCNSVQSANAPGVSALLGLLNVGAGPVQGLVGLTCTPLSVLAISGNSCNAQTVCCSNNSFKGVVALGCMPINANL